MSRATESMCVIPGAIDYMITKSGRVFSTTGWRGIALRELDQTPNSDGYPSVRLTIKGKRTRLSVHGLMAKTFLPPRPTEQHEIRHLDGDKMHCTFGNLSWGTRKENASDRDMHGRTSRGERHSKAIRDGLAKAKGEGR